MRYIHTGEETLGKKIKREFACHSYEASPVVGLALFKHPSMFIPGMFLALPNVRVEALSFELSVRTLLLQLPPLIGFHYSQLHLLVLHASSSSAAFPLLGFVLLAVFLTNPPLTS